MNPVLQEILHNITTRLAALEESAQSEKLLVDLIQEQRAEIDRLRHALAQPEQEPVCDKDPHLCGFVQCQLGKVCKNTIVGQFVGGIPEVSQQREWVGLTGLELNHIFAANVGYPERMCRAIEAKLKEKNGG